MFGQNQKKCTHGQGIIVFTNPCLNGLNKLIYNRKIKQDLQQIFCTKMSGLQSLLCQEKDNCVDRLLIDNSNNNLNNLDSYSNGSIKTQKSSVSTKSQNSQASSNSLQAVEDLQQKYLKDLKSQLKSCILTKKPPIKFKDIAGNDYAKKCIEENFILPSVLPNLFQGKPKPFNKILLYGPPGVGKTMICHAVCNELQATPFWVSLADITSKFIGESEKLLKMLFDLARENSPSIIIFDEMDSIGRKRNGSESETERRIKTEFLKQLDEINSLDERVYILATTNMPWELDVAVLRRFERRVLLPLPKKQARMEIFKNFAESKNHGLKQQDFDYLSDLTDGYSGSDIVTIINDAFMRPIQELQTTKYFKQLKGNLLENFIEYQDSQVERIYYTPCLESEVDAEEINLYQLDPKQIILRKAEIKDFKESIRNCKPTVSKKFLDYYNKFLEKCGHVEQKDDMYKDQLKYMTQIYF
ncbi:hypothetical protein ABPG74_004468 [Tetrahymena malaccensis]